MTAKPIAPDTLLDDLHPARFLKVADLLERWKVSSLTVSISRVMSEETTPKPGDIDPATRKARVVLQPVIYFKTKTGGEFPRGYLLGAKVDVEALKSSTGAKSVGELAGKVIEITVGEHKGKAVLRISPTPATKDGSA